ncbi:hypothetical protein A2331_00205 [Candidatus Falkowbacteria bacterium RIFOXYB2_FULL_34_18]|uniref:Lycopene cyclase domain-containing protein n=1 Tax=Candidatus Falkowbacteria bacterium RIFOXYD2_FULL_34_120 TaxID=1798007 RepID=A0A1F5TSC3_9BACT|nr:MAG: hypothetical protein A2331_00205 [Candidatus Falkowbacteria bacterium RIFOXYB2_FULL_34_18]OGF29755.1 MAG: hypothetical protein A2500_01145 [Candidatus Falkowbacteria bacterium RIFOXYC12_FULL_34_55]OGF37516.1 MAG: hypothetical protein A2466_00765 [Candidatus Falkowbacteria bacterium RIFOXYC2_FULL_34_220]OGF39226.1 MAG: hypothetical protein A2515_01275 [Candidatus Falkowbacteria bacterium RIFOXYD12_FULL_34_57]OGF41793.1 MAG: hypothetical protein A2531_05935 [Candidatus Falkowbacteria bact
MLVPYKFTYFIGALLFFVYWLYFWIRFGDNRRQMIVFSIVFAILGPISGIAWFTKDWWYPDTILGYRTGIEDILLGFSNGGVASVVFLFFYQEKENINTKINIFKGFFPLILIILVTTVVFIFTPINSFYSNCFGIVVALAYVFWRRPDLFRISLLSGILMMIISAPIYLLLVYISPGWVERTWMLDKLSGIVWLGAPIEDLIWYFFVGASISTMYPYLSGQRYIFRKNNS